MCLCLCFMYVCTIARVLSAICADYNIAIRLFSAVAANTCGMGCVVLMGDRGGAHSYTPLRVCVCVCVCAAEAEYGGAHMQHDGCIARTGVPG